MKVVTEEPNEVGRGLFKGLPHVSERLSTCSLDKRLKPSREIYADLHLFRFQTPPLIEHHLHPKASVSSDKKKLFSVIFRLVLVVH